MTPEFVADTNLQNQVKAIWMGFGRANTTPPVSGAALDSIIELGKISDRQNQGPWR